LDWVQVLARAKNRRSVLGETKESSETFCFEDGCHVDMVLIKSANALEKDCRGNTKRQGRKPFSVNFSPRKQRVASMERETVVVLVEVLDPGKPTREHWGQRHSARVKVLVNGQTVESWVTGQNRAGNRQGCKAQDIDQGLQNGVPMEASITGLPPPSGGSNITGLVGEVRSPYIATVPLGTRVMM
jgi:hypothetical protein